jgi:hypothetical protein
MTTRWIRALGYFPIYVVLIGLAAGLWPRPVLLTGCYAVFAAGMLTRWHGSSDVGFFCLAAILGPLGEVVCIRAGAWEYAQPWGDIPIWLPLAWGIAGLYLKKTTEVLTGRSEATG